MKEQFILNKPTNNAKPPLKETRRNQIVFDICMAKLADAFPELDYEVAKAKSYTAILKIFMKYFDEWIKQKKADKEVIKIIRENCKAIDIRDTSMKGFVYIWTYKSCVLYVGSTGRTYCQRYNSFKDEDTDEWVSLPISNSNYKDSYHGSQLFKMFLDNHLKDDEKKYFGLYACDKKDFHKLEAKLIAWLVNKNQVFLNQKLEGFGDSVEFKVSFVG